MFRVEWLRDAVNELADIWIKADSPLRQEITKAARTLDKELESDPFRNSESREADTRISFAPPLAILFESVRSRSSAGRRLDPSRLAGAPRQDLR